MSVPHTNAIKALSRALAAFVAEKFAHTFDEEALNLSTRFESVTRL
jgi:hypothetical protein